MFIAVCTRLPSSNYCIFEFWFSSLLSLPLFVSVPKLHPGLPENRFGLGTPEKNAKAESKVEASSRSRSSSCTPTSPKPLLQSPKPTLAARPTIPQKPRTASQPGKDLPGLGTPPGPGSFTGLVDPWAISRATGRWGAGASVWIPRNQPTGSCKGKGKGWVICIFCSTPQLTCTVLGTLRLSFFSGLG